MSAECERCGGRGWVIAGDLKTAHMRERATFRPCADCNRVESSELEAAAQRAQRDIAELIESGDTGGDAAGVDEATDTDVP